MEQRFFGNLLGLSFMRWWFLLIPKVGMTLFVGYVCYVGWLNLGPHKPAPSLARMKVADRAIEKIVDSIQQNRGEIRSAALCHFANDESDYFSHKLRESIEQSNVLALSDIAFAEKLRNVLNLRNKGFASSGDAIASVRRQKTDGVLWGRLDKFESVKGSALISGEWQLIDKNSGDVACQGTIEEGTGVASIANTVAALDKASENMEIASSAIPWHMRFLGYVLLALLLPVVTIAFIRTMVSKRSNRTNAFLLGIYTTVDAILAFFLVGCAFNSFPSVAIFLGATLLAFLYNVALMSFALRLETK